MSEPNIVSETLDPKEGNNREENVHPNFDSEYLVADEKLADEKLTKEQKSENNSLIDPPIEQKVEQKDPKELNWENIEKANNILKALDPLAQIGQFTIIEMRKASTIQNAEMRKQVLDTLRVQFELNDKTVRDLCAQIPEYFRSSRKVLFDAFEEMRRKVQKNDFQQDRYWVYINIPITTTLVLFGCSYFIPISWSTASVIFFSSTLNYNYDKNRNWIDNRFYDLYQGIKAFWGRLSGQSKPEIDKKMIEFFNLRLNSNNNYFFTAPSSSTGRQFPSPSSVLGMLSSLG